MAFHGGAGGGGGSGYDPWGRPVATQRSGVPEGRPYGATDEDTYDQGVPTLERPPMVASNDPSTLPNVYASQPHVPQPQPQPQAWPATPAAPIAPSAYRPSRPAGAVPTMVSGDPAEQMPWAAPPAFSAPPPRKGVSPMAVVIGAVVIAGSSFAAGWLLRPDRPPQAQVVPPAKVVAATAVPSEAPAASATAAPRASSEEQRVDADAGTVDIDNALPADESDADLSKLLADQGYLIVRSSGDAEVVVNGIVIGHTNRLLVSRCYTKHVRLREGSSQRWLTEGQPVDIACGNTTTVRIDP